ncbi:hypothetical protein AVEN_114556-1 [Araneus ventricosus]|uniref:Uncharacterized protein n=1 Tax=Araneus ventricosus TaxID=182803 RepID=A0A4Y2M2D6_ARAVE|nr:hypothetical protein AVEN_114556-1 [Araneus ventricosus]
MSFTLCVHSNCKIAVMATRCGSKLRNWKRTTILQNFGFTIQTPPPNADKVKTMDLMHVTSHPPTRDLAEAAIGQS